MTKGPAAELLVVAHDVRTTSPSHPRIRALLEVAAARGTESHLVTAFAPGDWARPCTRAIDVVPDPVLELYLRVARRRAGAAPDVGRPGLSGRVLGALRRAGGRLQARMLFPDNETPWSKRVRRWALGRRDPWSWVVTCARPESVGYVGEALAARGVRWWFDFSDGWTEHGLRREASEPGRRRERERALEQRWVAAASGVSTVDCRLGAHLAGLRSDRDVLVYPNGIARELEGLPHAESPPRAGPLRLVHLGRLRGSDRHRSLGPARELFRGRDVVLEFRGAFDSRDEAEFDGLRAEGIEVEVGGYIAREQLAAARRSWDGGFVIGSPDQMGSSSKLLDTIALRLPVLAVVPRGSVAAEIVERLGAGVVAPLDGAGEDPSCWSRFERGVRSGGFCVEDARLETLWCSRMVEPLAAALTGR